MKPPTKGTMEPQKHPSTPTLKRPQNRRDVFHKKSPYIQRAAKLSLEDLDGIFDSYDDEDIIPPSPVEETQTKAAQRPRGKVLQSEATSNVPDLDIVLNSPFKNIASFKTSSPIDSDTQSDVQHGMERISPIPFNIEEEEEPERVLQKPTDLMHTFEVEPSPERIAFKKNLAPLMKVAPPHIHTFEVESPPERITLKKIPDPLKKVEAPREETGPGASKTLTHSEMPAEIRREKPKQKNGDKLVSAPSREPQPPALENPSKIPTLSKKGAAPQQENGHPPVMAGRLENPENTAQEKLKETPATSKNLAASDKETGPRQKTQDPLVEKSSRGGTNFYTVLQKLKESLPSKPAPPMKVCLPIRAPTPPLEEDEFWIMEPPPVIQLFRKKQIRPRPKQGTTSNAEVKGSADKFSKETQPEEAEQRQASGEAGTDRKIPSKERTAAEEMKKRGPKSKAVKDKPVKDREFIQEPDYAVELQSQEPPGNKHGETPHTETDVSLAEEIWNPGGGRKCTSKDVAAGKTKNGRTQKGKIYSPNQGTTSNAEVKGSADKFSKETQPEEAEKRQASGEAGTDRKIPSKERTAAEEMKKRGPKSKAGKDRPVKDREFIQEPDYAVELQSQEPPGNKHGETLHTETDVSLAEEIWNPGGGRECTSKDVAVGKTKNGRTQKRTIYSSVENTSSPDRVVAGKRASSPDRVVAGKRASSPDRVVAGKRQRKPPGEWWLSHGLDTQWNAVEAPDVDAMKISQRVKIERTQKKQSEPGQKANKKKDAPTKVRKKQHRTTGKTTAALSEQIPNQEDLQQHADYLNFDPVQSKSLVCPLGEASITTGDCLFNKQASNAPKTIPDHVESRNMNHVSEVPENDVEIPAIQVQKPNSKSPKIRKKKTTKKHQKLQGKILFPVQEEQASLTSNVSECPSVEVVTTDITETSAEYWLSKNNRFRNSTSAVAFAKVQGFTSGPSSMIALEACEEQDTCLPSSVIHSALSATELCVFPLAPVALQAMDEENLTKWFSLFWPAVVKTAPQMNTDAFRWFSYRHRMIGVCEDLLHDNWCVGKMILGSHAQKPLWVDHSATTVYTVLNSAVSVTIDGAVSQHNPGLSFAVPCGHAHNINNLTDEPAVLIFNRQRNQNAD